jgi:hypothetical protein
MLYHHHGADPATAHPALVEAMATYWNYEIGSEWLSSPHENEFPTGAHAGFKNLVETGTDCPQLKPKGDDDLCVNAYLLQVHALGTNAHGLVPVHSYKAAMLVCDTATIDPASCGVVLTGGWHDYGLFHAPYKQYSCPAESGLDVPPDRVFITPYVALATEHLSSGQNRIFWNSTIAPVMYQYFQEQKGYIPNQGLNIVWSEVDAWDQVEGNSPACADPTQHMDSPDPAHNGTGFQVFSLRFDLPTERPFVGYTDRHGNVVEGCTATSLDCIPLVIGKNTPQGRVFLNRNVGPSYAPILEFDNGEPLLPPPFNLP